MDDEIIRNGNPPPKGRTTTIQFISAVIVGCGTEAFLFWLFYLLCLSQSSIMLLLTFAMSIICFGVVPAVSESSPNIEISVGWGFVSGIIYAVPLLCIADVYSWPWHIILLIAGTALLFAGIYDVFQINEWRGSSKKLIVSCILQALFAFSVATFVGFVITIIYLLASGGGKKRKR